MFWVKCLMYGIKYDVLRILGYDYPEIGRMNTIWAVEKIIFVIKYNIFHIVKYKYKLRRINLLDYIMGIRRYSSIEEFKEAVSKGYSFKVRVGGRKLLWYRFGGERLILYEKDS